MKPYYQPWFYLVFLPFILGGIAEVFKQTQDHVFIIAGCLTALVCGIGLGFKWLAELEG